jgi:hypothetical protein
MIRSAVKTGRVVVVKRPLTCGFGANVPRA